MLSLLHYDFILRGLAAGTIIALVAPLIGIFLVLRRYSLIADTLAHVSFAGVALGVLLGFNPLLTAIASTMVASLGIDRLRESRRVYGESALSLFLSGSLALAVVLMSLRRGGGVNLSNYLFGSIVTVTTADVIVVAVAASIAAAVILFLYKALIFISFDEEAATVAGLPVRRANAALILAAALVVALSIPIIGILLISALVVIPVLTALQFRKSFTATLLIAEAASVLSVWFGIVISFYLNIATGGTIVLVALGLFLGSLVGRRK